MKHKRGAPSASPTRPTIDPVSSSLSLLESLVHPLTKCEFMDNVWQRRCYTTAVQLERDASNSVCRFLPSTSDKRADSIDEDSLDDRVSKLVDSTYLGLDVQDLISNSASDNIFVWTRSASPASQVGSFELDRDAQAKAALQCYLSGSSLYFRSSREMSEAFIVRLCNDLGVLGSYAPHPSRGGNDHKGEIEIFLAQKGHVTGWHQDYMENFTVQICGTKEWTLVAGNTSMVGMHPVRGWTPHYENLDNLEQQAKVNQAANPHFKTTSSPPSDAEQVTIKLTSGDVLYHPAGVWHKVKATSNNSVSINFSLFCTSNGEVVRDYISTIMMRKCSKWREYFKMGDRSAIETILQELRHELQHSRADDIVPPCALKRNFENDSFQELLPDVDGPPVYLFTKRGEDAISSEGLSARCYIPSQSAACISYSEMPPGSWPYKCVAAAEDIKDYETRYEMWGIHTNFGNEELSSFTKIILVTPLSVNFGKMAKEMKYTNEDIVQFLIYAGYLLPR